MSLTQPLSIVANVSVSIGAVAAATPTFNQGLIVGPSTVIPTSTRLRQYTSLLAMASDGFSIANQEYLAAQLYFGQVPAPTYLWVGRQDLTGPETALQALQACRAANPTWYACMVTDAATADHQAIASWIQAITPVGVYFCTTSDTAVLNGTAGNLLLTLQSANYSRVFSIYSTIQSGAWPNNTYASAAAIGKAMGLNTGLASSYFTMKFKQLASVGVEPLTQTQINNVQNANGNLALAYSNGSYSWLEQGVQSNGQFFDEIVNLDMLAADIQYSLVNELISMPSIPLTNAGETHMINIVNQACERAKTRGFIAEGVWHGSTILNLESGDPLPHGYLCQAQSFALQSSGDRAARKAMPIYVALCEAGSMHSLSISVSVQR